MTGNLIFDFYTTYFTWLLNLTNPNYYFSMTLTEGAIDNPFISIFKVLIMAPFIMFALYIPVLWVIRVVMWVITVWTDGIN